MSSGICNCQLIQPSHTHQPPPHTHRFEREGDDLVHTVNVTLEQALTGVDVSVETLDGRTLRYVCVCLVVVV